MASRAFESDADTLRELISEATSPLDLSVVYSRLERAPQDVEFYGRLANVGGPLGEESAVKLGKAESVVNNLSELRKLADNRAALIRTGALNSSNLSTAGQNKINQTGTRETNTRPPATVAAPEVTVTGAVDRGIFRAVRPNPLRNYTSSTYNIKFGVMTPDSYNKFVEGDYSGTDKNIMIASGGIPTENRAPYFEEDFFIEDLQIEHVIGLNTINRIANSTEISFTIIEPNGFTFLSRIYYMCRDQLKVQNYLNIPYFLKISFLGYDDVQDSHEFKKQSPPFIVPLKLTEVKSAVTQSGSEYQIRAVSFGDSALFSSEISVKPDMDVDGRSVSQFLENFAKAVNEFNRTSNENQVKSIDTKLVGSDYYTEIEFEPDEDIGLSFLINEFSDLSPPALVAQNNKVEEKLKALKGQPIPVQVGLTKYRIPNGSNIIDVVDNLIQTSKYITEQGISDESLAKIKKITDQKEKEEALRNIVEDLNRPLQWYKIKPTIKLKEFNPVTGRYGKKITYRVVKYLVSNGKIANFPGWGEALPVKRYNYIFTGKNEDVLDFKLNFDVLYHQIILSNPGKNILAGGSPDGSTTIKESKTSGASVVGGAVSPANAVQPLHSTAVTGNANQSFAADGRNSAVQEAKNLAANLPVNPMGDMVQVDLEIIGDPEFMIGYNEKDFISSNADVLRTIEVGLDNNNLTETAPNLETIPSISSLDREINCYISIKTPRDYDPETGMLLPSENPAFIDSLFDGVYKIITLRSSFSQGVFRQVLNCVRLFNQSKIFFQTQQENQARQAQKTEGVNVTTGSAAPSNAAIQDTTAPSATPASLGQRVPG